MSAPAFQMAIPETPAHEEEVHELVRAFADDGLSLNQKLLEMLGEHFSHRTERRGCGYAQACRHLAVHINRTPEERYDAAELLFPGVSKAGRQPALAQVLASLPARLCREESQLLAALMADIVTPRPMAEAERQATFLPFYREKLEVGTCSLAEKYFLELATGRLRRGGRINVLIDAHGQALLLEKESLGDSHSCISLGTTYLNGVLLPPGSLFAACYQDDAATRQNRELAGNVIPIAQCTGFRFLRLTTLAIAPEHRRRAFTSQFDQQVEAGFFSPGRATLDQLSQLCAAQL